MNPHIKEYFQKAGEMQIGNFLVTWDGLSDFLTFTPSVRIDNQLIDRILVRDSTTKHYGVNTFELLFEKLIPSRDGQGGVYDNSNGKKAPSVPIGSVTASEPWELQDKHGNSMGAVRRGHEYRIAADKNGKFLDWFHLSPIGEKKFREKHPKHPSVQT